MIDHLDNLLRRLFIDEITNVGRYWGRSEITIA